VTPTSGRTGSCCEQSRHSPGARPGKTTSSGYALTERSEAIAGYSTYRTDKLPRDARPSAVTAYYRRKLRPEWQVLDGREGQWRNFRKGDAWCRPEVRGKCEAGVASALT
jgi:hypothetical protein